MADMGIRKFRGCLVLEIFIAVTKDDAVHVPRIIHTNMSADA